VKLVWDRAEGEETDGCRFRQSLLMVCTVILIEASRSNVSTRQQIWLRLT